MSKRKATEELNGGEAGPTRDVRVLKLRPLIPPAILSEEMAVSQELAKQIHEARSVAAKIIDGTDDRIMVVVGPCSIHNTELAMEYARELKKLQEEFAKDIFVVMRVYFEKPRTTVGWKGLINDPDLNGTFNINKGLRIARQLLLDINTLGLPVGTEFLDSISPQFTSDLITWGAIGARTTESQIHRELASGLSCPIGFKNGTGGSVQMAVDAISSASNPHSFLGVTEQGLAAIVSTTGNESSHIILRGGSNGPNYEKEHIESCQALLDKAKINARIMVDCSHGNSNKDHKNQPKVAADLAEQIASGSQSIAGLMIESNINEGKQSMDIGKTDPATLKHGVSITDACVDIATTKEVLQGLAAAVQKRREAASK
ncbi:Phospho-2-dehydro-3-deoxyheptonate aldolase, tyrosine-inhibited [Hondaea fermentalgiana]|uniref:3-deoxy-7-phosphoheptulonate synthase n=1 Tax=Hondaea fermentalgiana TaxID=2315210 RepID=A0A2R5GKQ1_9STRA|nr:Phospho-2-dehydro-3-deoxyheptonate aldolase, tyrosine-inhibited [Hondaea fermentalgiana]|eukprot:GBG31457.1 Phospho-2-dehydro-3-deoxyheptonate aldolase, tyrosine-inhibited [Hondaea fermentalgiana]